VYPLTTQFNYAELVKQKNHSKMYPQYALYLLAGFERFSTLPIFRHNSPGDASSSPTSTQCPKRVSCRPLSHHRAVGKLCTPALIAQTQSELSKDGKVSVVMKVGPDT
jgi:hypothetical protein